MVFVYFLRKKIAEKAKKKLQEKYAGKKSKKKLINAILKRLHISKDSWIYKKVTAFTTPGTFANFVYTSFLGFVGGILLTYVFFFFFVFQLNFSLTSATVLCSILGVILTLGLAFYMKVRCIVFLLLPQFCSKRGRQALMAYAFILTLTGPLKNTLHNIGVLSESLACGQDQLKQAVKAVLDLIKQPFYALKDSVKKIIESVRESVERIKESLMAIKTLVLSILSVIKDAFEWLASIVNICNKTLGTPYDRCTRAFDEAIIDCEAKLGPLFYDLCNIVLAAKSVCYIVKPLDFICGLVTYVADAIVEAVETQVQRFVTEMRQLFYVKVKLTHSFKFETNQSKTFKEVSSGIATEIRQKTETFLALFDWMSFFTSFFFFFMLLRILHYRYKWLTSDKFDNRYITVQVKEIDEARRKSDKETILPLGNREKNKYTTLTSLRLVKAEKLRLAKSTVFLSLATFKFVFHITADYSLYWMLDMIRYHGRIELKVQKPNSVGVHVSGTGFLAELYKSIIKAFSPVGDETYVETLPCLPEPNPPDYNRYSHITMLIIFCWLTIIIEPYGLRLRHVVMNHYHPDRARQRAVWLFNHIIRSRGSFLKFARRQLRRKFGMTHGKPIEKVTLTDRLYTVCPKLKLLFPRDEKFCVLCGIPERANPHIKCPTPGCVGLYCTDCFADMQNLCTICKSPLEYGDLSDLSEEKDSSEEEIDLKLDQFQSTEESSTEIIDESSDELEDLSDYSYQYEISSESLSIPGNGNISRDIEAQKLRDDVTTQIFEQGESDESDESLTVTNISRSTSQEQIPFYLSNVYPENVSEEEKESDKETDPLLPETSKSQFGGIFKKIVHFFTPQKSTITESKPPPLEELKYILEKTRKVEPDYSSDQSSASFETIILLNESQDSDFVNNGYIVINENLASTSESDDLLDFY